MPAEDSGGSPKLRVVIPLEQYAELEDRVRRLEAQERGRKAEIKALWEGATRVEAELAGFEASELPMYPLPNDDD